MNYRLVTVSAHGRPLARPVVIQEDAPGLAGALERHLGGSWIQNMVMLALLGSLLGSLLHHLLGVGTALVLTLLLVPVVSATVVLKRSDEQDLDGLQRAFKAALVSPLLLLSGAAFGALSLLVWGAAGGLVYRLATRAA